METRKDEWNMVIIKDITHRTPATNKLRNRKAIKKIVRHYSATPTGNFDSFWNHWNGTRGWSTGGYHEIILRDGSVELCYPPERITNGVANKNSNLYHICLVGDKSTGFTEKQEEAFYQRTQKAMKEFGLSSGDVYGHGELASTSCPNIDMHVVRNNLRNGRGLDGFVRPPKPTPTTPKQPIKNTETSIVNYLKKRGIDSSFNHRSKLAKQHGITNYRGTASQNIELISRMKNYENITINPSQYNGNSLVDYLKSVGQDSSFSNRSKLAKQHGIKGYKGTSSQNIELLNKLRK